MDTKSSGYFFLFTGIFIMALSVILVILAFLDIIHPSYFGNLNLQTSSSENIDINSLSPRGTLNLSALLPSMNILPPKVLDKTLNLTAHFLLMTFIGGFGYKLSMIGVNLVRPIVIKTGGKTFEAETLASTIEETKAKIPS